MRVSAVFTIVALMSAAGLTMACSSAGGGGGSEYQFKLRPPTNFNPSAGLLPGLTDSRIYDAGAPPFNPQ
jgi:hypothetical protein